MKAELNNCVMILFLFMFCWISPISAHDISYRAEISYSDSLEDTPGTVKLENLLSGSDSGNNTVGANGEFDPEKYSYVKRTGNHKGQTLKSGKNEFGYKVEYVTVKMPAYESSWNLQKSNGSIRVNIAEIRNDDFVHLSSQNLMAGAAGNPGLGTKEKASGKYVTFKLSFPVYLKPDSKYGFDFSISAGSGNFFEWAGTNKDVFKGGKAYVRNGLKIEEISGDRTFRLGLKKLTAPRKGFQHPGTLHSQSDLDRMKKMVGLGKEPWKESFEILKRSPWANKHWSPRPMERIVRGIGRQNYTRAQLDGQAIYELTLMWHLTGDKVYADRAVHIVNSWPPVLKGLGGNSNVSLAAGIVGYLFAIGADLLSTYPGWKKDDQSKFKEMMIRVFYSSNHDFLYRKHGTNRFGGNTHYRMNWDSANIASMAAIGILCDNEAIYRQAIEYFKFGDTNGRIERAAWYIHPNGMAQTEEMGRDQPHNLFGIHNHLRTCQMAWNQGDDLFGYSNFRMLRAVEYITKYNLGNDVESVYHRNTTLGKTERVSGWNRGGFIPMYELVLNHYVKTRGMAAPYSEIAGAKMRPEPVPNTRLHPSQADWFGLGTLTYTKANKAAPAKPQKLNANWSGAKITLSWLGTAGAKSYSVWKSLQKEDGYKKLATVDMFNLYFEDTDAVKGRTYYYKVSADMPGEVPIMSDVLEVRQKLVTHYSFENNLNDNTGQSHGTGKGDSTGKPEYSEGVNKSRSINLDGVDDYIQLPAGISQYQDVTIAAWIYWRGGKNWQRVFDFGSEIEKYIMLTPSNGKESVFKITTSRGYDGTGELKGPKIPENSWIHVVVTLNGDCGTLYFNGKPVDSQRINEVDPLFSQLYCYLGRSIYSNDPYFNGKIDDFRIYNYALSGSEVFNLVGNQTAKAPVFVKNPVVISGAVQDKQVRFSADILKNASRGSALQFEKVTGPVWLKITENGQIQGTPPNENRGENYFVVRVTDKYGLTDDTTLSIPVENINDKPVWKEQGITLSEVTNGNRFSTSLKGMAEDPDRDEIKYQKLSGPEWVKVDSDGRIYGNSPLDKSGIIKIFVGAVDSNSALSKNEINIPVLPNKLMSSFTFTKNYEDSRKFQNLKAQGKVEIKDGRAVFDGENAFLQLEKPLVQQVFSSMTIATWVKWNGGKEWQRIFDFGKSTGSFMFLTPKSPTGKIRFGIKHDSKESILEGPEFPEKAFVHLAVTISSEKVQLYINGKLASEKSDLSFNPADVELRENLIGKSRFKDPLLNGEMSDFHIFNYALSKESVQKVYSKTGNEL